MPLQPKQQPPYYQTQEPIKTYIAILTQTGTNNPIATVIKNTLGGDIVWTRQVAGQYTGTLTGAFPTNKTIALTTQDSAGQFVLSFETNNENTVNINNYDNTWNTVDSMTAYIQIITN